MCSCSRERSGHHGLPAANGMQLRHLDEPLAAQVLRDILASSNVWQGIRKPFAAKDCADGTLEHALRAFQNQHVIDLAPWPKDARDHADQEHPADACRVRRLPRTEVDRGPRVEPRGAVPCQLFQILAHWMVGTLAR